MSDKFWGEVMERDGRRAVAEEQRPTQPAEGYAALPGLDDPYKAFGNVNADRQEVLCVVLGRAAREAGEPRYRFFEYQHKASDASLTETRDGGHVILLRFICPHPLTIIFEGDELLRGCHQINRHSVPWVRLFDQERQFPRLEVAGGRKAEIIRKITIVYDDPADDPRVRLGAAWPVR